MTIEERVEENIECGNWECDDDFIICPYCEYKKKVEYEMYFGDKSPDVYTEGEEDLTCPECGHTFTLTKEMKWEYTTEIKEDDE